MPQQPYPQQPQQPGAYPGGPGAPGAGQYGQPGFGGPGAPPPKKKTGLIVGIAIGAVVLIGGAVALVLFLTSGGSDKDQVEQLADDFVTAVTNRDPDLAAEVTCTDGQGQQLDPTDIPEGFEVSRDGEVTVDGDSGTIPIKVTQGAQGSQSATLPARKQDGSWCVGPPQT
ncbi:hypothetical protein FFT09_00510 [Saccharomonospora piscinae]|nr:hypothetical protein FFT09_00510 [Saccharomonospora piscinae]